MAIPRQVAPQVQLKLEQMSQEQQQFWRLVFEHSSDWSAIPSTIVRNVDLYDMQDILDTNHRVYTIGRHDHRPVSVVEGLFQIKPNSLLFLKPSPKSPDNYYSLVRCYGNYHDGVMYYGSSPLELLDTWYDNRYARSSNDNLVGDIKWPFQLHTLYPKEFLLETPPEIVADWYEENGNERASWLIKRLIAERSYKQTEKE